LILFLVRRFSGRLVQALSAGALATGVLALLAVPLAWALSSVLTAGFGVLPSADLMRLDPAVRNADARIRGRFGRLPDTSTLVAFLRANRHDERYLLATSTTQLAAPIIIETGERVMARGGFHGLDSAMTPESLAGLVEAKQLRFAMLADVAVVSRRMGADAAGKPVADWIRANGKLVPSDRWRSRTGASGMELYDLRPAIGLLPNSPG
jgi:4-amino-4-deoxy-L-arabinose transferase-like glycosyltransferase